jgi:hypothetical protein
VKRKLDMPYVRTLAASSDSARQIWSQAAPYAWLLVRLLDALATRDMGKISPVAAEYDRFAPAMNAFWEDLYRTFTNGAPLATATGGLCRRENGTSVTTPKQTSRARSGRA